MTGSDGTRIFAFHEFEDLDDASAAIDEIFFTTSNKRTFAGDKERSAFRERWLGRYLERWPQWCFVACEDGGEIIGYLAGCPDNPATSPDFADHRYYTLFEDECRRFPAHLHINVLPVARGRGAGNALIEAYAKKCAEGGLPGFHAVTADGNRNNRFFEGCGLSAQAKGTWNGSGLVFFGRAL